MNPYACEVLRKYSSHYMSSCQTLQSSNSELYFPWLSGSASDTYTGVAFANCLILFRLAAIFPLRLPLKVSRANI